MGMNLYVGNLPFDVDDAALAELFGQHGTVESAKVIMDPVAGRSRGFGFVQMSTEAEAQAAAAALNNTEYSGRTLTVNEARPRAVRR